VCGRIEGERDGLSVRLDAGRCPLAPRHEPPADPQRDFVNARRRVEAGPRDRPGAVEPVGEADGGDAVLDGRGGEDLAAVERERQHLRREFSEFL